jgi:light-regulated signal transduction histidine kinase (bacteriophytochrome)
MRSDRLLRGMHKVFSHDLPNQMVALQSLLQLLSADEAEHLGNEGQEYVRRLQSATLRACEQVRFLKEMGRINAVSAKAETITLRMVARELQGELQQKHASTEFAFEWQWHAPTVVGDPRTFALALSELFSVFVRPNSERCQVSAESRERGDRTELTFRLEECNVVKENRIPGWTEQTVEQRMEIVLAREWLALSGARLEVLLPGDGTIHFVISIPNR